MKSWLGVIGVGMFAVNLGCARETPLSPSEVNDAVSGTQGSELTTTSTMVTLTSDLTASPSSVTVSAGSKVLVFNQSGRYAKVHSYNCSEFSGVNLPDGTWIHTWVFTPAGKTCDYFVWDVNRSRKLFEGKVLVE
jgi:hypothetical protein